jgi:hypothetical protein
MHCLAELGLRRGGERVPQWSATYHIRWVPQWHLQTPRRPHTLCTDPRNVELITYPRSTSKNKRETRVKQEHVLDDRFMAHSMSMYVVR